MGSWRVAVSLARATLRETRVRDSAFAAFFAAVAYVVAASYDSVFPTVSDRLAFARTFGSNEVVRLFVGKPYDLLTSGGYTAWRFGGFAAIVAASWGAVASVRALRGAEDRGTVELVLAQPVARREVFAAFLVALGAGCALLWAASVLGLVAAGLPLGGSAFLALATVSPALPLAATGAIASQTAANRRIAAELTAAVVAGSTLLRAVADTVSATGWLRWLTPLGWAEEARAFAGARPGPLVLSLAASCGGLALAWLLWRARDVGQGAIRGSEEARARTFLLRSSARYAVREHSGSLAVWAAGTALFGVVLGMVAASFDAQALSEGLRRRLAEIAGTSLDSPEGAVSYYFLTLALALAIFACQQIGAIRREETEGRLATVLALPIARTRWFAERLALAALASAGLAVLFGACIWVGVEVRAGGVGLGEALAGAVNTLPVAFLFLALAALLVAVAPRIASGASYGFVLAAFTVQLLAALADVPKWVADLSPFAHLALVPAQPFATTESAVLLACASGLALVALAGFRRRDVERG